MFRPKCRWPASTTALILHELLEEDLVVGRVEGTGVGGNDDGAPEETFDPAPEFTVAVEGGDIESAVAMA